MRKFFAQSVKELAPERRWKSSSPMARITGRRSEHGSTAFEQVLNLSQPQDGAQRPDRVADIGLRLQLSSLGNVFAEPEDARLTGGTRSLMRRALGLNFGAIKPVRRVPATPGIGAVKPVAA